MLSNDIFNCDGSIQSYSIAYAGLVNSTDIGYEVGLISEERYEKFLRKKAEIEKEIERLKNTNIKPNEENNAFLEKRGTTPLLSGTKMADLLKILMLVQWNMV